MSSVSERVPIGREQSRPRHARRGDDSRYVSGTRSRWSARWPRGTDPRA